MQPTATRLFSLFWGFGRDNVWKSQQLPAAKTQIHTIVIMSAIFLAESCPKLEWSCSGGTTQCTLLQQHWIQLMSLQAGSSFQLSLLARFGYTGTCAGHLLAEPQAGPECRWCCPTAQNSDAKQHFTHSRSGAHTIWQGSVAQVNTRDQQTSAQPTPIRLLLVAK